jgi:hypothetical protein
MKEEKGRQWETAGEGEEKRGRGKEKGRRESPHHNVERVVAEVPNRIHHPVWWVQTGLFNLTRSSSHTKLPEGLRPEIADMVFLSSMSYFSLFSSVPP